MSNPRRSAAQILNDLAVRVRDYINERNKIPAMRWSSPTSGEIRQFMGLISGRPTGMTEIVLRVLERQGHVKLTPLGNGEFTVHVKGQKPRPQVPKVSA